MMIAFLCHHAEPGLLAVDGAVPESARAEMMVP